MCQIYPSQYPPFMYHHAVYIYTQGPEPIQLDPLVSPPLASSTAAAAPRVCGDWCENCVFAASQQQIGCLSVWDRGPFYQQFHSIVKCENNKLSIQYRTDTIWISKG